MSVYEALLLMINFSMLVVVVLSKKDQ
ncbi:putative holin-like toxin [Scopulibacillus darangshiensis]